MLTPTFLVGGCGGSGSVGISINMLFTSPIFLVMSEDEDMFTVVVML